MNFGSTTAASASAGQDADEGAGSESQNPDEEATVLGDSDDSVKKPAGKRTRDSSGSDSDGTSANTRSKKGRQVTMENTKKPEGKKSK